MKRTAPALAAAMALALSPAASAWAQEHHHHGGGGGGGGGHHDGGGRGRGHEGGGGRGYGGEGGRGYGGPRYDEGRGGEGEPRYDEGRGGPYDGARHARGGGEWAPPVDHRTENYRPGGGRPSFERPPASWRGERWDGQRYNGYFLHNRWFYGPPPTAYYGLPGFQMGFSAWRRGAQLPAYYRGWVMEDYLHYHLRRPPNGYHWLRIGNDFLLVSDGSGLIFDVIQGDR